MSQFDCAQGTSNWRNWQPAKKDFCCHATGTGCPPVPLVSELVNRKDKPSVAAAPPLQKRAAATPAQAALSSASPERIIRYDCDAGFENWQVGWSPQKKLWCCQHQSMGCVQPD